MATSLRTRKKSSVSPQPTVQDLAILLSRCLGLDLTQEYDPDTFSSMAVDMYQATDPDVYTEQGLQIYTLLQQLCLTTQQETAIVKTERRTKVWYQHSLTLQDKTDSELVDDILANYTLVVKSITDPKITEPVAFIAIEVLFNE